MPAVTSVTNFSDGNVLTATALNAVNCGIHVYADAAARDAAYGGSGERTLVEGEFAYLLDTNATQYYDGAAWNSVTPTTQFAIFNETQAINTNGGSSVASTFTKRILNTTNVNTITGCSIASSVITLAAGSYYVTASAPFHQTVGTRIRLQNTTDSTTAILGQNCILASGENVDVSATLLGYFTIAASKNFELQYFVGAAVASTGLGRANNMGSMSEVYGEISIQKVS